MGEKDLTDAMPGLSLQSSHDIHRSAHHTYSTWRRCMGSDILADDLEGYAPERGGAQL